MWRELTMCMSGLVNLYSNDVDGGLHSYRDLLGFTETFRTPVNGVPDHVELLLGGFAIGLSSVAAARRVHGVEATPGSPVMSIVVR
jgi:lactoylglutathione lyase